MRWNLARLLRPKNFTEIVGQATVKSMLRNLIFLDKRFPAYMFFGPRGCGKTTTARVFAKALNCEKLAEFRINPKTELPCQECSSCRHMQDFTHPDFIEMDAASHTGVDNIRNILEQCTYQPVQGQYKIYLIDEAHMLSKAAFNALLKIMEEPPETVVFILATTEANKIPLTVRSRCFLGTFKPLSNDEMLPVLQHACQQENVQLSIAALQAIIDKSQGSLRDALNLFEQLICLPDQQKMEDALLQASLPGICKKLVQAILQQDPTSISGELTSAWQQSLTAEEIFAGIANLWLELCQIQQNITLEPSCWLTSEDKQAWPYTLNQIVSHMHNFWQGEEGFLRSAHKKMYLASLLIFLASPQTKHHHEKHIPRAESPKAEPKANKVEIAQPKANIETAPPAQAAPPTQKTPDLAQSQPANEAAGLEKLRQFISSEKSHIDPFVLSILQQVKAYEVVNNQLILQTARTSPLLQDKLNVFFQHHKAKMTQYFGPILALVLKAAAGQAAPPTPRQSLSAQPAPSIPAQTTSPRTAYASTAAPMRKTTTFGRREKAVDVSDVERWPKANLLIKYFGGKVVESN